MKPAERIKSIKESKLFKVGDIAVALLALVVLGFTIWTALRPKGAFAEIYLEGRLIYSLPLDEDTEVSVGGDDHFRVKIENRSVFVSHSDCPGQNCVYAGAINAEGGAIICLPNKIVIRVVGGNNEVKGITS
ncbi:MAG: NusG domain II-containing protein [Clostridiales bacterium]|jgi:hypothetical protein|nr:NusG domain II-containing protein [Clostridiales bacterium]